MIKIVANNYVKDGCVEQFKKIAAELVEKSRAEKGNKFYNLHVTDSNPNLLTFIEGWENQSVLDVHGASEHFRRIVPLLGELCERPMEITFFNPVYPE